MLKIWLVARREYLDNLKKPSFLFAAFGLPLIIIAGMALSMFLAMRGDVSLDEYGLVGFVDRAEIVPAGYAPADYPDLFTAYAGEEQARADLDEGRITAYFVIPEDYFESGRIQLYSYDSVPTDLNREIRRMLVAGIDSRINAELPVDRIVSPVGDLSILVQDSGRELTTESIPVMLMLPMVFAFVFSLATQVTSSILMSGLVEEKSNRIMEILVTSITPVQLLGGKIFGLGLLGLTQLLVWVMALFVVLTFGSRFDFLEGVVVPGDLIVVAVVYFILGYFLMASIMSCIGVLSDGEQESRQYAGVLSLLLFIPFFFIVTFMTDPNGPIPVALSMIPFTAPMGMVMRAGLGAVPLWQLLLSSGILLGTTLLAAWLSARLFRWGMLRYGKKFSLRDLFNVITGRARIDTTAAQTAAKEATS
jgi:ABC-2 type transport system permease protein